MIFVADSNVYVSALVFGGTSLSVLKSALVGEHTCAYAPAIREEVERTLERKFHWEPTWIAERTALLWNSFLMTNPPRSLAVCRDPHDDRVLECALACAAECIVTGDNDLLVLSPFQDIGIVTPAVFQRQHVTELGALGLPPSRYPEDQ